MESLSRLGMEFGQYVQQVTAELLLRVVQPGSLSEMERGIREAMLKLGHFLLTSWLALQNERYPAESIACECGQRARYQAMRDGVLYTIVGRVVYRRAYYRCGHCHRGCSPLDARLGLRPGELSAELEQLTALIGVHLPFGQSSQVFEQLTLVRVSPQSIDKTTQAMGQEMAAVEAEWITDSQAEPYLQQLERHGDAPRRLYGTLDATKVHTSQARNAGEGGWRDLKIGGWFETPARPPTSPEDAWASEAHHITYYCDIVEAERFGDRLWATGVQRRAHLADELICVADGAEWIWKLVEFHFPQAIQIVDWFHAAEYLPPVAALAGTSALARQAWLQHAREDLWDGRLDALIAACQALVTTGGKEDAAQKALTYFSNNRHRLNYPDYRAKGYQIGSGTIESGCKQIGTQRLKVPGATWDLDGARRVAKARAVLLSDQWELLARRRTHLAPAA